jgi:hypothetical protein
MTFRVTVCVLLGAAFSTTLVAADDRPEPNPSAISSPPPPAFAPMTRSERLRNYLVSAAGYEAILRSVGSAGIRQAEGTPKEWGGGAEGYLRTQIAERCWLRSGADLFCVPWIHRRRSRFEACEELHFQKRLISKRAVQAAAASRHERCRQHVLVVGRQSFRRHSRAERTEDPDDDAIELGRQGCARWRRQQ